MGLPNDISPVSALLELYDEALPHVYGYLVRRCDHPATAEDLTADTFLAAVAAHDAGHEITVGWLIGTARHKLVDHWRRTERHRAALVELWDATDPPDDHEGPVDTAHVRQILDRLAPPHRAALVLRYVDGLSVPEVAALLDRSVHATESLLMRAKAAYRNATTHINDNVEEGRP